MQKTMSQDEYQSRFLGQTKQLGERLARTEEVSRLLPFGLENPIAKGRMIDNWTSVVYHFVTHIGG